MRQPSFFVLFALLLISEGRILPAIAPTFACHDGWMVVDADTNDLYFCSGGVWHKASSGGGAVSSVFGRTGAVTAATNDYSWSQIASKPSTFPPDAHTHAESDVTNLVTDLAGKEQTTNKNAASGYAGLSAGSKITASQMSAVLASSDLTNDSAIEKTANKNAASGYAGLDGSSKLTASQIPNNAANTSGTAGSLGSTPSLCPSGQAPTGVLANGNATGCTTITGGGSSVARLTADTGGSATNTLVTTGMTFSLAASTTYTLDCNILFTVSATSGVGLTLGVNGPGTPTQVTLMRLMNTSATAFRLDSSAGASWAAKIGATATTVTSLSSARLTGTIENGGTAGTLDVQYANIGTTGTTIVKRGSFCRLQ